MNARAGSRAGRQSWEVHLNAPELAKPGLVGRLHRTFARTGVPASFEYDASWLHRGHAFMLDPRLELWRGEQHPDADMPAFGIFMDSAPDRWGRLLMERREAAAAQREQRPMRALREVDFLLGVSDEARMGALRLRDVDGGPFLDHRKRTAAPPVTRLRELAAISRRVDEPGVERLPEYEQWLAMLVAPGSSLGGARPKANFRDTDQSLWLAKFPARDDRHDVGAWEYVIHRLAASAGVHMAPARLESLGGTHRTFCTARFDRRDGGRRMFASAMTLLQRRDGDGGSYIDLAQVVSDHGARGHVDADLAQLFRRALFNVLVGNRDDHLRNHGFIREPTGWRLAPAFDVNPSVARFEHTLTLDGASAQPDPNLVMATAGLYRLAPARAQAIFDEVRRAVAGWRAVARAHGLGGFETQQMQRVFQA